MEEKRINEIVKFLLKSRKIRKYNDKIESCPNCNIGNIYEQDSIEKIGQCDYCFNEFRLAKGVKTLEVNCCANIQI